MCKSHQHKAGHTKTPLNKDVPYFPCLGCGVVWQRLLDYRGLYDTCKAFFPGKYATKEELTRPNPVMRPDHVAASLALDYDTNPCYETERALRAYYKAREQLVSPDRIKPFPITLEARQTFPSPSLPHWVIHLAGGVALIAVFFAACLALAVFRVLGGE